MKVTTEIPDRLISDMIITALEQGCDYWACEAQYFNNNLCPDRVSDKTEDPLNNLSRIVITEDEDGQKHKLNFSTTISVGADTHRVRDFSQLTNGLAIMADKYPYHYANVVGDNHDAETADVFIQCCLFGEIVYG